MQTRLRRSSLLFIIFLFTIGAKAQYVAIPDTIFANWITALHPTCMSGHQLDTTCPDIVADTAFDIHFTFIHDLTGVQYFKNVTWMYCDESALTYIPAFPPHVKWFDCFVNHLTSLPALPSTLLSLKCSHNRLTSLPALPAGLTYLDCSSNYTMTALPALPGSLVHLECQYDQIPGAVPALPASLEYLDCSLNRFSSLPALPSSLQYLYCYYDSLSVLPTLPASLLDLECEYNHLTALPAIPSSLQTLACDNNRITGTIPALPNSLTSFTMGYNDITALTNLPDSMILFYCRHNLHLACLPQLGKIGSFTFDSTAITCLGNYPIYDSNTISNSTPDYNTVPLCTVGNANGCARYTVGVKDVSAIDQLSIYPNPVRDVLTIDYQATSAVKLSIYDAEGRCITIKENTHEINISSLTSGIYFLQVSSGKTTVNRKFVKE